MVAMLIWEKRLLFGSTAATLLAFLFQIIAVGTTSWIHIQFRSAFVRNASGMDVYITGFSGGLWRSCEEGYTLDNSGTKDDYEECKSHKFFPEENELKKDKTTDIQIVDYVRTGSAFAIISLLIMMLGHIFAFYTLRRPRYIVKRLTSLMHFMTAACVLVENEVFIRKISYTQDNLPDRIPAGAETSHGYSFVMSWISFVAYVIAGAVFLFTSHKRKADMADEFDECVEEDDPVVIRR